MLDTTTIYTLSNIKQYLI